MAQGKTRDSNIELLRILTMLMIIGHHFAVHGGFRFDSPQLTANVLFLQWLSVGGKLGVNLFVLISGYFLVTSKGLRLSRVIKFWLPVFFYSVVIYPVCALAGLTEFQTGAFLETLIPLISKQWWFASSYFVMYLLHPLMNRLLRRLTPKWYLVLLGILTVLWSVYPVLPRLPERLRDPLWFMFLYIIAGYLRLHGVADKCRARIWLVLGAVMMVLGFAWTAVRLSAWAGSEPQYEILYLDAWNLLCLLASVGLFLGFAAMKLGQLPAVNTVAAASFGIYLIHDSDYLRYPLWRGLFNCAAWGESPLLIPYALAAIALVFVVCLALERLRIKLLDGPFSALSEGAEQLVKKMRR